MLTEGSPEHRMSGEISPRDEPLSPRYHEVLLENSASLTLYLWVQMTALQHLPGRVPVGQSGFHFPNVLRQIALELVQKRPEEYTYNGAMNVVKGFLISETVTNFNTDLSNIMKFQCNNCRRHL